MNIDINSFLESEHGINAVGELFRDAFFNQKEGHFGCYSTVELNPDVVKLPDEKGLDEDEDITYTCAEWNGVKARWYWDGDGYLEFTWGNDDDTWEDGKDLYGIWNDDCKKSHGWQKF